jgi:hypothetical protein
MKTRTLTLMLLLLGAAGVASADESMEFQNRGPKEGDKYQAWSHDWSSPTLGTAAVARVTEDYGHGVVAKSHYGVNSSSSAALGTVAVARVTEDDGHGYVPKSHDGSHSSSSPALEAPEIDAATLVVALTLLVGALAVLRARRAVNNPAAG